MKNPRPDFDTRIITPVFRLSYPHVFEAKLNTLANRHEYTIQMLFDKKTAKADLMPIFELMQKIAVWKFGAGAKGLINPIKDGDTATNEAGELKKEANPTIAGMMFLTSWSKNKPGVVNAKNEIIINPDEIYGGCYARAQLNGYAYEKGKNRGIAFGLMHIQKVRDGDSFGTRGRPEDAFAPLETADMDDEFGTGPAPAAAQNMFG